MLATMKWMIMIVLLNTIPAGLEQTEATAQSYSDKKESLERKREALTERYKNADSDSAKQKVLDDAELCLLQSLSEELIPTWFGTPWDYNGISAQPGKGEIACGYFVSTVLKHAGFQLNRYKLAQQYSHSIVNSLCGKDNASVIRSGGLKAVASYLHDKPDGLFVVGLDFHVGFIEKWKGILYFTHSNYIDRRGVERELLFESEALAASSVFVIGSVVPQPALVEKWLLSTSIPVVP